MADDFATLALGFIARAQKFQRQVTGARDQVLGFGDAVVSTRDKIATLTTRVAQFSAAILGIGGAGSLGFGLKLAADAETAEVAFTTMTQSGERARKLIRDLQTFSESTPFEFGDIRGAANTLLGFRMEAERIPDTLRRIGDIAAGTNQPIGELALVYAKAKNAGRLMMDDVNELSARGVPIIAEVAKQFGIAESEVRKFVERGQVSFANLEEAFRSLTAEGGMFAGMTAAQSKTLAGLYSTLRDKVKGVLRDIGTALVTEFNLKGVQEAIIAFIKDTKGDFLIVVQTLARVAAQLLSVLTPLVVAMANLTKWVLKNHIAVTVAIVAVTAFVAALVALKTVVLFLVTRAVVAFVALKIASVLSQSAAGAWLLHKALLFLALGFKKAAITQAIFWALSGPAGWAVLAAAAGVAVAAVWGVSKAYGAVTDSAKEANKEAADLAKNAVAAPLEVKQPLREDQLEAIDRARQLYDSTRTPLEKFNQELDVLDFLLISGRVSQETYNRRLAQMQDQLDSSRGSLKAFTKQLERDLATFGQSDLDRRIFDAKALGADPEDIARVRQLGAELDRLKEAADQQAELQRFAEGIQDALTTPQEEFAQQSAMLEQALTAGLITLDQFTKAMNDAEEAMKGQLGLETMKDLEKQAEQIKRSLQTPADRLAEELQRIDKLRQQGMLTQEEAAKAAAKARSNTDRPAGPLSYLESGSARSLTMQFQRQFGRNTVEERTEKNTRKTAEQIEQTNRKLDEESQRQQRMKVAKF
ncbi:hypothetical protein Pan216_30410 [Planctomycetes bacterium Pan216]|uniref:Tape measure protein N-terminal domain-containing protein n=1 Tax=Kolteria novifilia TaxID=2527975 RepID=A0A518B5B7_9BACT|nr:hypothetical protein Pan216_30410 [Planctomycetes bacterium Pan216]